MRLFIAIELADGEYRPQPLSVADHHPVEHASPSSTFIAQIAAAYLRAPAARALERRAHDTAIASYRTESRDDGARLDRSV